MPGPGHYCIAAADGVVNGPTAPAWTIAARAHDATAAAAVAKSAWPGPATYDVTRGGPQGPAYSMQGKAKTTDGGQGGCTPGPVDYSPDPNILLPSVPCFTIAGRGQADSSSAAACATSWSWSW